jgi:hypothetical protein
MIMGSQYISRDFQKEIAFLGISSSPAFVRAPEGKGCAERFVQTLKENLLWIKNLYIVFKQMIDLRNFLGHNLQTPLLVTRATPTQMRMVPAHLRGEMVSSRKYMDRKAVIT